MQVGIASRTTRIVASQTDSEVASGEPIIVHGILCDSPSGGTVTFEAAGTETILLTVTVLAGDSLFIPQIWIADGGLQVTTPAGTTCTIWHSHPGR